MKHDAFIARLNEMLDQRRPIESDAEIRRLAAHDDQLRQLLYAYQALSRGGEALQPSDTPNRSPVTASVPVSAPEPSSGAILWVGGLVTAATLLIAITWEVTATVNDSPPESAVASVEQPPLAPPDDSVPPSNIATTESPSQVADPPLEELARDAAVRYQSLAISTRQRMSRAFAAMPGLGATDSTDAVSGMPDGLIDMGRATGDSVAALFRAIPIAEQEPNG